MNDLIRMVWVRELRSGNYKQGFTCALYNMTTDEYSALGVLVDIIAPGKWESSVIGDRFARHPLNEDDEPDKVSSLSTYMMAIAGLKSWEEKLIYELHIQRLSFSVIATAIENGFERPGTGEKVWIDAPLLKQLEP